MMPCGYNPSDHADLILRRNKRRYPSEFTMRRYRTDDRTDEQARSAFRADLARRSFYALRRAGA